MTDKLKEQQDYWSDRGLAFDAFKPLMEQSWAPMIQSMDFSVASSVLEVGAGRGYCSLAILDRLPPTATITSTDFAPGMVEGMKTLMEESERVKVMQANAMDLNTIKDASISHYIANMTIHIVPDVNIMLSESIRVLRDGGIAGFTFW
jgi:ubiquinone/menaquinone biosynthesis C-methylase UbiE